MTEAAPLTVSGPTLTLRYATQDDAQRLMELGGDPLVTRYFSWGPYTKVEQPLAYINELGHKRDRGEMLEFLVDHREHGPIGVTGLSEFAWRDRRATVGTWFGRDYWGTGSNFESKALVAWLGFETLGLGRLTAWANTRNGRSQVALERVGFRREGVLRGWHRHGDEIHDVVVFGLTRPEWERSALRELEIEVSGMAPPLFKVDNVKKG